MILQQPLIKASVMTVFTQEEKNNNLQPLHFLSRWLGLCPKRNNNQTHQNNIWCREERLNNHVFTGPGIVELSTVESVVTQGISQN